MGIAVLLLTIAGGWLRAVHRHHPMRYDESNTFFHYVLPRSIKPWFSYTATNNHLLHTILVDASIALKGIGPTAVRLPAFAAGVAVIPAAACFAAQLGGNAFAAIAAAMLVSVSSILIEYSVNARGYTMVCLFSLLTAIATVRLARRTVAGGPWILWIAGIVLGLWTIPIMLYPAAILSFVFLIQIGASRILPDQKKTMFMQWAKASLCCAAATFVLALPVIKFNGIRNLFMLRWIRPYAFPEVFAGTNDAFRLILHEWFRDTSPLFLLLVGVGLLIAAAIGVKRRDVIWLVPMISPILLVLFTLAQRVVPFARVWLFMLPVAYAVSAAAWFESVSILRRSKLRTSAMALILSLLFLASADAGMKTLRREFMISEDPRTLVDAEGIIKDLAPLCQGGTAVVGALPADDSLLYYQILYAPGRIVDYRNPKVHRAFLVVGDKQTVRGVMESNPGFDRKYGPLSPWKTFPHAVVYVAPAQSPTAPHGVTQNP